MDATNRVYCQTQAEWRSWLEKHHRRETEIWLIYQKGADREQELTYEQSVDEALCYGWIDSLIKRIDDTNYARKFTPRKSVSRWSESNRRRIEELEKKGRLEEAGKAIVAAARATGSWDGSDRPPETTEIPARFKKGIGEEQESRGVFRETAAKLQKEIHGMDCRCEERRDTRKEDQRERQNVGREDGPWPEVAAA